MMVRIYFIISVLFFQIACVGSRNKHTTEVKLNQTQARRASGGAPKTKKASKQSRSYLKKLRNKSADMKESDRAGKNNPF